MSQREQDPSPSGDDGTTTRRVRWLERTLMVLVVAASTLALSAHRLGASPSAQAPVSSLSVASWAPTPTPTPTQTPLVRAILAQAQPASGGQTLGVAAMVRLDGVSDSSASAPSAQAAASAAPESSGAVPQDAGGPSATGQTNGDSR